MRTVASLALTACALLGLSPQLIRAEVVGVDIQSTTDVANGVSFGDAGAYEVLAGQIRFAVDPGNPRNQVIAGLERLAAANADAGNAQREINAVRENTGGKQNSQDKERTEENEKTKGKIQFSADIAILRPKDPAKGNGTLLLDVVNRGSKMVLNSFDRAGPDGDDGFLMRRGFTVVWVGWEFDAKAGMRIAVPTTTGFHCDARGAVTPNAGAIAVAVHRSLGLHPERRSGQRDLERARRPARQTDGDRSRSL